MLEQLKKCPKCQAEQSCIITAINEFHNAYSCLSCGFNSSDLMREGEYDVEAFEETLPEIYKDIKQVDSEGRVWYPSCVNITERGTIFASGTTKDNWQWSTIKSIPLTKEEKKLVKFKGQKYKSDSTTLKKYDQDQYFDAAEELGLYDLPETTTEA